jgi:gas vesicle protein
MNKTIKFIAGAALGALTGAVVATLLSPGSGDETKLAFAERLQYLRYQLQEASQQKRIEMEAELEEYKLKN